MKTEGHSKMVDDMLAEMAKVKLKRENEEASLMKGGKKTTIVMNPGDVIEMKFPEDNNLIVEMLALRITDTEPAPFDMKINGRYKEFDF